MLPHCKMICLSFYFLFIIITTEFLTFTSERSSFAKKEKKNLSEATKHILALKKYK